MTGLARRARVCLAALLLATAGAIALPATAAADWQPTGPGNDEVFTLRNLTQHPLIVTDVRVGQGNGYSLTFGRAFPYPGQVVDPGQTTTWSIWDFVGHGVTTSATEAWVDYSIGAGGPIVEMHAYADTLRLPHRIAVECQSRDPAWTCHMGNGSHNADLFDTTRHDTEVPASDPALQSQLLNALCQPNNPNVHCEFTPTSKDLTTVTLPVMHLGDDQYNYTDAKTKHSWAQEWEYGTTMKVGGSYSPIDIDVENKIKVEVKVTYEHEWGTSTAREVVNGIYVDPESVGWIEGAITASQVTGNFRVGVGNDWWTLTGMTFVAPTDGHSLFDQTPKGREREMTDLEKLNPPPTS